MNKSRLHRAVHLYGDMVYRLAMVILRNPHDADDALQETFINYFKKAPEFDSEEHERAWLIRCATNACRSIQRNIFRHRHEPLYENLSVPREGSPPDLLLHLPQKERMILQLRYVEGYTAEEIAKMMNLSAAAVRKRLERARKRAKEIYEKECV